MAFNSMSAAKLARLEELIANSEERRI